jgi:Predicted acyl-CoA transferases/carnitine dehydratase
MSGILDGIKVIDMSRLLPGPFCTQMLGDLGADVIKIEEPVAGDYMRWIRSRGKVNSGLFLAVNRNKRSMKLDVRKVEGKEALLKLVASADVLVEGNRPGVMNRLGVGYETLRQHNPRIIMCSISGFGQDGPFSQAAGHDINYLSITGIMDLIGNCKGSPVIPGIQIADISGGALWAAFSIMAALFAREKTGKGQYLDISMADGAFTYMSCIAGEYFFNQKLPQRGGEPGNGANACYNVYKTKDDRYLSVGIMEEKFWEKFCSAIGHPEYVPLQYGVTDVQEKMKKEVSDLFITKTADEWMEVLGPLDICVTKVKNIKEALEDEQMNHRGMIIEMEHPVEGKIKSVGFPVKFSEQPYTVRMSPPTFGQHTDEVLQEVGYTPETIKELRDKGVV